MTKKINLEECFITSKVHGKPCNSPEDFAIREKINQEMEKAKRELVVKFNRSQEISRRLILRSHIRS